MVYRTEPYDSVAHASRPCKRHKAGVSQGISDDGTSSSPPLMLAPSSEAKRTIVNRVEQAHAYRTLKALNPNRYLYVHPPPTTSALLTSMGESNIPSKLYQSAYYSVADDLPENPREYAGVTYHLKGGGGVTDLEDWGGAVEHDDHGEHIWPLPAIVTEGWEYANTPPSAQQIRRWLLFEKKEGNVLDGNLQSKSQVRSTIPPTIGHLTLSTIDRRTYSEYVWTQGHPHTGKAR